MFAWFERHLQPMKYSGRWGPAGTLEAQRDELLEQVAVSRATLTLDPAPPAPSYWLDHDIHQHPGGLAGDLAGFVYDSRHMRTGHGSGERERAAAEAGPMRHASTERCFRTASIW